MTGVCCRHVDVAANCSTISTCQLTSCNEDAGQRANKDQTLSQPEILHRMISVSYNRSKCLITGPAYMLASVIISRTTYCKATQNKNAYSQQTCGRYIPVVAKLDIPGQLQIPTSYIDTQVGWARGTREVVVVFKLHFLAYSLSVYLATDQNIVNSVRILESFCLGWEVPFPASLAR